MRCVRKKTSAGLKPTKTIPKVRASLAIKSYPELNFRHKFSLLVTGPSQSGKTYFVQQILEDNRIVYEEQRSIRILWYYNQWQDDLHLNGTTIEIVDSFQLLGLTIQNNLKWNKHVEKICKKGIKASVFFISVETCKSSN
jgi:septin family protein